MLRRVARTLLARRRTANGLGRFAPAVASAFIAAIAGAAPAEAQQSASFQLKEHVFNAGGRPDQGIVAHSASFQVTLDAIGESVSLTGLASSSFSMGAGFVAPYPPPGEVRELRFSNRVTLVWKPEPSTGTYGVYRGAVSALPGLQYGSCLAQGLTAASAVDNDVPTPDQAFFYLITARNLLDEEGTKGFASNGNERANNAPCP